MINLKYFTLLKGHEAVTWVTFPDEHLIYPFNQIEDKVYARTVQIDDRSIRYLLQQYEY